MRAPAILFGLLTLGACATQTPPDHTFAVFFSNDSAVLDVPAQAVVLRAATASKQFPALPVYVAGYADRSGSPAATIAMSQARADAVANLLISDGVPATTIQRKAVGTPPNSQPGIESRRVEIDLGDQ
jgi:outer membrane protein OmpA-like peptidoglycan-associated protein